MFSSLNTPIADWGAQRVWLIGASSGIGAALAKQMLNAGAEVVISARRLPQLQQVAADYQKAHIVPLDVSDQAAWAAAYAQVVHRIGTPDLVVFCAADYRPERSWEVNVSQAESTLRINLLSAYAAIEQVLPAMLARGTGGVALIASVAGYLGLPNASVYGPSKAALINLAEILYSDLHPKGLNVYLINPGFVKTGLTAKNTFAMPALQTPQQAAMAIWQGISAGEFEIHFPRRFTRWLKLLQLMPYRLRFALFERYLKIS
ncbi:SDR family NAD(P)-dependent oxidoreductase [Chitinibacter bivalviorum]|uniref:SDR family NAD(P)-dependent oxidoreductase n=1 Tax=Chitinibacter bivalviorum TaxID=2739434 RepID=A0A7H9BFZ6_9NEIS|nr:SDR family NAD(P)-dependent oxidoreductase [Chitinibacter bivalviorum]QLG87505.1 SDR family NAD(P)-dependent oxidoreductase [Chitinibacter bivalviorum]